MNRLLFDCLGLGQTAGVGTREAHDILAAPHALPCLMQPPFLPGSKCANGCWP